MKHNIKQLVISVAIPLTVGGISAFLTQDSMQIFRQLEKPPLSPPGWLFPVIWTILFILMGIASWLVFLSDSEERDSALFTYLLQLAVNFFWPIFFFRCGWYFFSLFWLFILWYLVFSTIRQFGSISQKAALLLIPYLIWLTYAGYLNLFIALLN